MPFAIVVRLIIVVASALLASNVRGREFPQLYANPFEARIQTVGQLGPKTLRLDIGAAPVLFRVDSTYSVAAEFFTLTRLRSEGNLKFPVETSDYWFGFTGAYTPAGSAVDMRVRLAHISSHLVDGYANTSGQFERQLPFVYSREFVEAIVAYRIGSLRPYAGLTWVWSIQPRYFDRVIPHVGLDYKHDLGGAFSMHLGHDTKMIGIDGVYVPQHATQIGIQQRYTAGTSAGISLYRFDGRSIHGMFSKQAESYLGIGLSFSY
jgi:hypothetical protein